MQVLQVRNVHQALPEAVAMLKQWGYEEPTRNGPVLRYPQSVCTTYMYPRERVLFWPQRNANPFFHLYEALWMLGGRQDVVSLTRFVKRMLQFSDNGSTFHGAYGHRWRHHFDTDQLAAIVDNLHADRTSRRQVLQMWDCRSDLHMQAGKRDLPCNLVATFQVNAMGALDLTVFCRSNDIVWGCYGANAVHFSMLHEYVAIAASLPVGMYEQISVNWHAYLDTFAPVQELDQYRPMPAHGGAQPPNPYDPYEGTVTPFRLINTSRKQWDQDLGMFLDEGTKAMGYQDIFFRGVALPMLRVHDVARQDLREALKLCDNIKASDWRLACQQWLQRRMK